VTTVTARGRYAPDNVGAIWISDASGKFVKTLQVWGTIRLGNATAWTSVSFSNTVDAVTGATRHSHGPLQATWDCTDLQRAPVANGAYKVNITFAESDAAIFFAPPPIMATVDFNKGSGPVDVSPPATANFTGMHLTVF